MAHYRVNDACCMFYATLSHQDSISRFLSFQNGITVCRVFFSFSVATAQKCFRTAQAPTTPFVLVSFCGCY